MIDAEPVIRPDERAVRHHLATNRFRVGVIEGKWNLAKCRPDPGHEPVSIAWPHVFFEVYAAPRDSAPVSFFLRLEMSEYPGAGPTGILWDCEGGQPLPPVKRPLGDRCSQVFRRDNWNGGVLYAAWDRVAFAGHAADWSKKHPHSLWHAGRDVTFYLERVWDLVNDGDYRGINE